jgi:hypothetical protein
LSKLGVNDDYHLYQSQDDSYEQIEYKKKKVFAIVKSDTIVYPRTMMIHAQDTFFAFGTVVTSLGFKVMAY